LQEERDSFNVSKTRNQEGEAAHDYDGRTYPEERSEFRDLLYYTPKNSFIGEAAHDYNGRTYPEDPPRRRISGSA
jgi:hypothetical protein